MIKKICFVILSAAILVIGVTGFSKLSYWDRSVRIFSISSDTPFEGRIGRSPEGRGEFFRPEMRDFPDSLRARFEAKEDHHGMGMRESNIPDSLKQQFGPRNVDQNGRSHFEESMGNGRIRGRGEFSGSKRINLRNLKWFLAVFVSFTVIAIYIDKTFCLIRMKKSRKQAIN